MFLILGFGDNGVFKIIRGESDFARGAKIEKYALAGYYDETRSSKQVQYDLPEET